MSSTTSDLVPQASADDPQQTENNDQNEHKITFDNSKEKMNGRKNSHHNTALSIDASSIANDQVPEKKDVELASIVPEDEKVKRRFPNLESFSLPSLPQGDDEPISVEYIQSRLPKFTRERIISTCLCCLSSFIVLSIRLYLDSTPTAYLIHSIIILIDMMLIHIFTNCLWLSISGEIVTVICFLSFHFSKETVTELMETTVIAALCSFHMILERNKHMKRENQLADITRVLHNENMSLRTGGEFCTRRRRRQITLELGDEFWDQASVSELDRNSVSDADSTEKDGGLVPVSRKHLVLCGQKFFEHFLDGSAGVMYTSFLGLIIDEFIKINHQGLK